MVDEIYHRTCDRENKHWLTHLLPASPESHFIGGRTAGMRADSIAPYLKKSGYYITRVRRENPRHRVTLEQQVLKCNICWRFSEKWKPWPQNWFGLKYHCQRGQLWKKLFSYRWGDYMVNPLQKPRYFLSVDVNFVWDTRVAIEIFIRRWTDNTLKITRLISIFPKVRLKEWKSKIRRLSHARI